jgi:N-acetyl-anhydromuramyl-L-alanine amidase AmpD
MQHPTVTLSTPNKSSARINPTGIILHHSAGTYAGTVSWCINSESRVSYHCIVATDGSRTILGQDTERLWHAGVSAWRGRRNCNDFMLGIAVSGDTYRRRLTPVEIDSVAGWCVEKMQIHRIALENVTTHRKVSPGRKNDISPLAEVEIRKRIIEIISLHK